MTKFVERLKEVLNEKQISQRELSKMVNLSHSMVSKYCSGKNEPTVSVLVLICNALGESADFLIGLKDD